MSPTNSENNADDNNDNYVPYLEDKDNEVSSKISEESCIFKSKIRKKEKLLKEDNYEDNKDLLINSDSMSDTELRKRKMIEPVKKRKK